jgi:aspartate aminotransferase
VDVSSFFGRQWAQGTIEDGDGFARFLLETAHVVTVGGSGFGSKRHVRLSFALSRARLEEGFDRIAQAVARLG